MFLNKKIFFVLLSFLCFLGEVRSSEITEDTTFYFVRHGITDWSMDTLLEGPQDLPLNESGIAHIQIQGDLFSSLLKDCPGNIVSSTLLRCTQTSDLLKEKLSLDAFETVSDLQEVYRGDWSKLDGDVKEKAAQLLKNKNYVELMKIEVPDAEEWGTFLSRMNSSMNTVLTNYKDCPIIVTHGQFIKEFLKQRKCWGNIENDWVGDERAPVKVVFEEGSWTTSLLVGL